jgi:hypothetical protein
MKVIIAASMLACIIVSGCAGYRAVDSTKAVAIGDGITVQPQVAWATAYGPGIAGTIWTIDGLGLNDLRMLTGVVSGQPLVEISGIKNADLVHYDVSMLPDDVSELTVSTLGKLGYEQSHSAALRPAPFGSTQGFRFDLTATKDGLDLKGLALAAQRHGKLDLILFIAPKEYYFDRYSPVVERLFSSIQTEAQLVSGSR